MEDRKIVDRLIEYLDLEILNGGPDKVINKIKEIQDKYKDRDIYFYVDSYYESTNLQLREKRLETDKEYADRLKIERKQELARQKAKKKKEEKERTEYERLKKKFGM